MDGWALTVAVLAFLVSAAALMIAWWQLVLQRHAAGGRGVIFNINAPMRTVHRTGTTERVTHGYRVFVRLVGNDRYDVAVHLERDGRAVVPRELDIEDPPALMHRWTCEDDPIRWSFDLDPNVAEGLWCVLLWASPFGEGLRTDGFRRRLGDDPQFEQWRWRRGFTARRRFESWASQHGPAWFRRWAGRPRRLGEWRPYRMRELQPGQSPVSSAPADR
ncbi:hypothetical protein [Mycolicibacterium smegmatis]|uniref:Uncharacterized protein n=1 Tax=Mycolicibacterium smegmatis (strain MKD8) TaxID=1214915 RepID=A0A2U9PVI7_MYCSE|nr:hypothetical protein [Mycolicibacterium smegmatis]AWT55811.1 hypothetical protein D806_048600 [Mycolicibacterium smegmatis MKD8]